MPHSPALAALIALAVTTGWADEPKPPEPTAEERKLAAEAAKLNAEGGRLYQEGKPADAVAKMRQALEILQKLYPAEKYPAGHADLTTSLGNLGLAL